jgi:hypothetical protein
MHAALTTTKYNDNVTGVSTSIPGLSSGNINMSGTLKQLNGANARVNVSSLNVSGTK